jgi:hypothetical protein
MVGVQMLRARKAKHCALYETLLFGCRQVAAVSSTLDYALSTLVRYRLRCALELTAIIASGDLVDGGSLIQGTG